MGFPPVHPALVHLPIAFAALSVVADFLARLFKTEPRRVVLRTLGFGSLVAALIGITLTIAAGYWDMHRDALSPATDHFVDLHLTVGWILGGALLLLLIWRWLIWHRGQMTINTAYLIGGFLVLGLTLFQGWFGGEMVYSYGAGVAAAGQGTQPPEAAQSRLTAVENALGAGNYQMGGGETPGGTNESSGASKPADKD